MSKVLDKRCADLNSRELCLGSKRRSAEEGERVAEWLLYPTGSGSRCSDRGACHLSLPGQILSWERRGGTGPGNHTALVLPAGRSHVSTLFSNPREKEPGWVEVRDGSRVRKLVSRVWILIVVFTPFWRELSSTTRTSWNRSKMVCLDEAGTDAQTCGPRKLAVRND